MSKPVRSKFMSIAALSLLLCGSLFAADFQCKNATENDVVMELIKLQLSGMELEAKSECLDQKNFKYIRPYHEPTNEGEPAKPDHVIPLNATISIEKIETQGEFQSLAKFTIKWTDQKTKKSFRVKDSIAFMMNADEENSKAQGCARLLAPTDKLSVYEECAK